MLPYICSFYDTGFKVLSMKINYFAPSKLNTNIIDIYIFLNVVLIIVLKFIIMFSYSPRFLCHLTALMDLL